jgi:DNA replication and repair protein RecF
MGVHLRTLRLTNYRGFRRLALELTDGPTVIQGANAQGKTNLLEAIELLATGKSSRASSERELIHWDALRNPAGAHESFARISAAVAHERGEVHADILLRAVEPATADAAPTVAKSFRLNGLPRRALDFIGEINVVAFAPADVDLVAGPPAGRRRYLDVMNAQMSRRYLRSLQRFNKLLIQRNYLLRQIRERNRPDPSLSVWDEELAGSAAFLFQERARSVQALNRFGERWFQELGGWGQHLEVRYQPAIGQEERDVLAEPIDAVDGALGRIHSAVKRSLERASTREQAAGMSLVGPHRDDLSFLVDGVDLNTFGSRGQQRLAALSLKLAELDVLTAELGTRPILLLDDVLSELDPQKQQAVLQVAQGAGQMILTVTDLDSIGGRLASAAGIFRLKAGAVVPDEVTVERQS